MKAAAALVLIAVGIAIGFGYGRWYGPKPAASVTTAAQPKGYYCPMHPQVRSEKPGDCPICGMKLVPESESGAGASLAAAESPAPQGTFHVSPDRQQLVGVTYATAERTGGVDTFRATGRVAVDETRISKVQTRIEGWVERVFADHTGQAVQKGEPLLTLYSPEMLASQQEYLLALRSREILNGSPLASSRQDAESLIAASRKRLELWELSEAQIEQITRARKPLTQITLHAPISGYVTVRNAFPKQRVTPETELYTLVDLSKVWIMAEVFESDAASIRFGMTARASMPYSGGRALTGRVSHILPAVDAATRTLKVRIEADNPGLQLKPEMFVDIDFAVARPTRVTVPADALVDTGVRKTVFVDRGNGHIEARQVETGERSGGRVEILRGLQAGERVVASGTFLIDSESQLRSAAAGASTTPAAPAAAPPGHKHD